MRKKGKSGRKRNNFLYKSIMGRGGRWIRGMKSWCGYLNKNIVEIYDTRWRHDRKSNIKISLKNT